MLWPLPRPFGLWHRALGLPRRAGLRPAPCEPGLPDPMACAASLRAAASTLDHGRPGPCERPMRVTIAGARRRGSDKPNAAPPPRQRRPDRGFGQAERRLSVFPYRDGLGSDSHPPVWSRPAPDSSIPSTQGAFAAYPCPCGPTVFHGPLVRLVPTRPAGPCATDPKADEEVRPGPDPRPLLRRTPLRGDG